MKLMPNLSFQYFNDLLKRSMRSSYRMNLDQAREAYLAWGSFLKFGFNGTFDFITQVNIPFRNEANLTFNVPSSPNQIFVEGELIIT